MTGRRPLVVVLGASGYLGTALSAALAARPIRLRLVARRRTEVPADPLAEVEVRRADLADPGVLAESVRDADAVIHLIAHTKGGWRVTADDAHAERVNVGLVRDLVEAIAGRPRGGPAPAVVFAGSALSGVDGADTATQAPVSTYCQHKLAAERLLCEATERGVLRGSSLRLPPVYGPGGAESPRVVELMTRQAFAGRPLTIWHDGTVRRDLVYIGDVTAAFLAALDHVDALAGRTWPIGSGRGAPLGAVFAQIAEIVAAHTGRPAVPVRSVPAPAGAYATDFLDLDIDATAFRAVTGWRPRISLNEGLTRTVAALAAVSGPAGLTGKELTKA